jgi:ribA/ribD-fused uncharacterized protein
MNWLPINTAPKDRSEHKMFAVIAKDVVTPSGQLYTTDPYYVWAETWESGYARWPHSFPPTHWHPMPKFANTIKFYSVDQPYGEFSNFAPYPVKINGKVWPTTEHYFQAQKFAGTEHEELIRLELSPAKAALMGRDRNRPLRPDWERVKDDFMAIALYYKFTQHPALRELLLSTGSALIVEHTTNDSYWGDGGDGTGRNMLGILLVKLRTWIEANQPTNNL